MKTTLTVVALGIALAGCSTTNLKAPDNYPQMTVKADEANTLVFARPGLELGQYARAYIAPVQVQISDEQGVKDVTDIEAQQLAAYTQQRLKEQMARRLMLVDAPGPDVLTVRFRITGLEPTSKAQVAMMVPPFAMINMLSPKGLFMGSITLAGELYEGLAKEPSVAFIAMRSRPGVDATVAFGRWAVAEKVIDNAAERLADDLAREAAAGR